MKKSLTYVLVVMLSYSILFLTDIVSVSYAQNTTGLQISLQAKPLTPGVKIISPVLTNNSHYRITITTRPSNLQARQPITQR